MAKEFIDIKDLLDKKNNEEAREEIAEAVVPEDEYLTAEQFVGQIVKPIQELQEDAKTNIKVIKFNGQTIQMSDGGVVEFAQSGSVDTYGVAVASDIDSTAERILRKGSQFPLKLRYTAIKISTIGETTVYRDVPGTMTITRQMKGSTLVETVYTERGIVAVLRDSEDWNVTIQDLAQYCKTGSQNINITFSTQYTQNGSTQTITGSVVFNMNVIDLAVESTQDYLNPLNGNNGVFPTIKYNLSGAVTKYLHIEVSGKSQLKPYTQVIELDAAEGAYSLSAIQDTALIGMTKHGVHTVKAWLTCDDGSGHVGADQYPDGIISDVCVSRFMVVNDSATEAEKERVYLLMQGTIEKCDNYTQAHLTDFGIWKSAAGNLMAADEGVHNIKVIVTDYSDGDDNYTQTYGELNFIGCKPLTAYSADCMIEIESDDESIPEFSAYMRILRETAGGYENMIVSSGLLNTAFVGIAVRNSADYAPTAGATFYLNPKSRSNNEADWDKIRNARNKNALVATVTNASRTHSMWQKDGQGIGVMRVLAGDSIEITGNEADPFFALFGNGKSDVSIELDYVVRNSTNGEDPVLSIIEEYADQKIGLELLPEKITMMCKGKQNRVAQSVNLREGVRTHLVVTLNHDVDPSDPDLIQYRLSDIDSKMSFSHMALCRTYVNGKCNNAFLYSTENKVWQNTAHGSHIRIGQEGTDIDIYGIRIYNEALTAAQIKQNVVASKTTAAEKDQIVSDNKIVDANGRIKKSLVENHLKRNTITLHSAQEQWKGLETEKQKCYAEIHLFDDKTGEELLDRGGFIGKYAYEAYLNGTLGTAKALEEKSQGSTANTYFMHNWQFKVGDITFVVVISVKNLHKDFGWKLTDSNPTTDSEGNVTAAKYPLYYNNELITGDQYAEMPEELQAECMIAVPDGWFDWNGDYHGQCWKPSANGAKAQKLCNKINYASSMVSHKMGMTSLFNDVMRIILGNANMLPKSHVADPAARFAVEEQPFFYFHQSDEAGEAVFHGFSTFGSAKADKPTWGYDKKKYPKMCMFEGADNNVPLADFRVPFDDDIHGYYDDAKGDWSWAMKNSTNSKDNELALDFDLGLSAGDKDDTLTEPIDTDAPWADITPHLKQFCNLFYTHNTRLQMYNGSVADMRRMYNDLSTLDKRAMETKMYWCTADYCMYRFNFVTLEWVDAGTWVDGPNGGGYYQPGVRNLSTDPMTSDAFSVWESEGTRDYGRLNLLFCQAIASHFREVAPDYICVKSFLTHYNLLNSFGAGTDNCSKNTYFVLCLVTINGEDVWRWYWFTDDTDTIFPTNNNGAQTKAWWIFRMSDIQDVMDGYKDSTDYEGNSSVMFNLCEDAYDDNLTRQNGVAGTADTPLQQNMREVLSAMQSLVSSSDSIVGFKAESSLMACWHKYFLQYSEYFPMLAFNECGRIRYEYPEAWGYRSVGKGERGVAPIEQHTGDQREGEINFLEKRSILFAQYACWGDAAAATGAIGVPDASAAISAKGSSELGQMILVFELKSDRPFYATGASGNSLINPHVRVMPGQTYKFEVSTDGDQGCGLRCSNYYTELGNFGNARVSSQAIQIRASHLRKLELTTNDPLAFSPADIDIACTNIESFRFGVPGYKSSFDLSKCLRLKEVDIKGSGVNMMTLPKDTRMESVAYNDKIVDITLSELPYLREFSAQSYQKLQSFVVEGNVPTLDSYPIILGTYNENAPISTIKLNNINWESVSAAVMEYLCEIGNVSLTGKIKIPSGGQEVGSALKMKMLDKFGMVDEEDNPLVVEYPIRSITAVQVSGTSIARKAGNYQYKAIILPEIANNFKAIDWEVEGNRFCTIDAKTGVLTVTQVADEKTEQPVVTVKATVTLTNNTSIEATMKVKMYNRVPKVGDWAYSDGEFDSEYQAGKTVVGWVYEVKDLGEGKYKCYVEACNNINFKTSDGKTQFNGSLPWGIYPNSDENSIPNAVLDEIAATCYSGSQLAFTGRGQVSDIPSIGNLSSSGLSDGEWYLTDETSYDDATNDGFRAMTSGHGDWAGKEKTAAIVEHANTILTGYVERMTSEDGETVFTLTDMDNVRPKNLTELADLMVALSKLGGSNVYRQLAYPAAYSCYLYEPAASDLHEQYKQHQWYLPAEGEKVRQYIYFRNSRGLTPQDEGTPTAAFADEGNPDRVQETKAARRPWYANLLKRAADAGLTRCPVTLPSQSFTWSSTEHSSNIAWYVGFSSGSAGNNYKSGSYVMRPCVAFDFNL